MRLRPVPARWFELLTVQDDLTMALEALARTNSVELESYSKAGTRMAMPELHERMDEFNRLAQHYQRYWPTGTVRATTPSSGSPSTILDQALQRLHSWRQPAEPLIVRLDKLHDEQAELTLIREMFETFAYPNLDFGLLTRVGPALACRLFVLPVHTKPARMLALVLSTACQTKQHNFLLTLGSAGDIEAQEQDLIALKGRRLPLPLWLHGTVAECSQQVDEHLSTNDLAIRDLESELQRLNEDYQLSEALGDIDRLEWYLTHVGALPISKNFAWVTGWTSDMDGTKLNTALQSTHARGLLRFPDPPRDKSPPMVMHNPWWAQPFEIFTQLLGTPARSEADPSRLLALIVPLLFGYMFGDVGQGAVLFLAGVLLQRHWPILRLLILSGLSAMLFGLLFGSVFGREDLIAPLWLHPMTEPITVLMVSLVAGMGILLLGLVLNGIEAYWRSELSHWWLTEAPLLVAYVGCLMALLYRAGLIVACLAIVWYLIGQLWLQRGRVIARLASAVGRLLEYLMRLFINTLSFVRVGAFALAHAGLSTAILGLAEIPEHILPTFLIMLVGNIVVIVLEGLVVTVQTARLVLFEFFIRFLRGEGRIFHPLPAPGAVPPVETPRNTSNKGENHGPT